MISNLFPPPPYYINRKSFPKYIIIIKIGINIVQVVWGLWLIPFGQLAYASGFIPRLLGVLLIVAGVGYVILSFTTLLFPNYTASVSSVTSIFAYIGELSILLWLLIIGVKIRTTNFITSQVKI